MLCMQKWQIMNLFIGCRVFYGVDSKPLSQPGNKSATLWKYLTEESYIGKKRKPSGSRKDLVRDEQHSIL